MSNLFYPYNASECFKFKSISFPLDESLLVDDMCADGLNHELSKSSRTHYQMDESHYKRNNVQECAFY